MKSWAHTHDIHSQQVGHARAHAHWTNTKAHTLYTQRTLNLHTIHTLCLHTLFTHLTHTLHTLYTHTVHTHACGCVVSRSIGRGHLPQLHRRPPHCGRANGLSVCAHGSADRPLLAGCKTDR